MRQVADLVRELNVSVPVVTSNGAEIREPSGNLIARRELSPAHVAQMRELARQHDLNFWGATVEGAIQQVDIPDDVADLQWLKFGFHGEDEHTIRKVWRHLEDLGPLSLSNSHPLNIEVNAEGVTKAAALQEVCTLLGTTVQHMIAMGDSLNDIAMIRLAGMGVAMGNAQPAVKEVADFVTRSNDEDGVAYAIECCLFDA